MTIARHRHDDWMTSCSRPPPRRGSRTLSTNRQLTFREDTQQIQRTPKAAIASPSHDDEVLVTMNVPAPEQLGRQTIERLIFLDTQ